MTGWRLLLLLLVVTAGVVKAADAPLAMPGQVRLVSEEWLDYTNADGSGLAWDVLRKVFEPAGVKVRTQGAPYSRAVGLVKRGEADAWVGSYHEENADNLYPRWHFDMDHIYALGLASRRSPASRTSANTVWPGCAAMTTRPTCPMSAISARSSAGKGSCRCLSMIVSTSISMP